MQNSHPSSTYRRRLLAAIARVYVASLLAMLTGCTKPNAAAPAVATPASPPSVAPAQPAAPTGPIFPDRPATRWIAPAKGSTAPVEFYDMHITGTGPGLPMEVNLYLPNGRHDPKSLPCVFIAPAGAAMWGMTLGDGDRREHVPYALAGFAVVAYEVSGDVGNLRPSFRPGVEVAPPCAGIFGR